MKRISIYRKPRQIAKILLCIWLFNIVQPITAQALTSGPGQPETQSFQPAGVSDMVDLFTGDFKYNIPLMDIDGYPINLNYQSGVTMDDEASWVGLGWNLNVGSINRQMRGLPDDFNGDKVETQQHTKDKVTVGGRITAKVEVRGKAKLGGSFSFGVFSDNYTGIGAEIGVNAGMSFSLVNDGMLTAGMGIGILSSTASGVDVTPNASLTINDNKIFKGVANAGLSSSLGYNSRSGLKSLTFGKSVSNFSTSSSLSYNTEPVMPKVQIPYTASYGSFSLDVGGAFFGVFAGVGGTGYKSVRTAPKDPIVNPGYGLLYAEYGKSDPKAVMDFTREKENPVIPELPNLAIPVHMPDIFSYNSQSGSGQFRLYRGGTGAFFDNETTERSKQETAGVDIGGGAYFHGGVTFFEQQTLNTTRKWTRDNNYLKNGDFQSSTPAEPYRQQVFFRKTDEKNIEDESVTKLLLRDTLINVTTTNRTADANFRGQISYASNVNKAVASPIEKDTRQIQTTAISYLTQKEATRAGLNKQIPVYDLNNVSDFDPETVPAPTLQNRTSPSKLGHHLGEMTINSPDGQRTVFGLPVYNTVHEEYSFAVGKNYTANDGLVNVPHGNYDLRRGIDEYYHKQTTSPYAYAYLITGVLSPDFVDKTGDGITPDDNGTAIKFNYSKIDGFKWRTPYKAKDLQGTAQTSAALNRAMLADNEDDKATVVYGEKEIYYVHSIESKTKIAYFITEDRKDGLGVASLDGEPDAGNRQRCLKEIRLYSRFDLSKPIKVVKFEYNYELCPLTPNSIAEASGEILEGGKLTLKKVWFEYGLTQKGANHPYQFTYNSTFFGSPVPYMTARADRWGSFKYNNSNGMSNEEYPYSSKDKYSADEAAALWHISSVQLPSGGKIDVKYEADDYAYVQNKRAMEMVPFEMLGTGNSLKDSPGIRIDLGGADPGSVPHRQWFTDNYLNGSDHIYVKAYTKMSTPNAASGDTDYDFVPVHCKIKDVVISGGKADITFETISEAGLNMQPIQHAAWQKLKNEYPKFAYPGFENRIINGSSTLSAAVSAIISAARNLSELKENFYQKANRKDYAREIVTSNSFARITKASGFKIGGGTRVQEIRISDEWNTMSGSNAITTSYGQHYEYTRVENGKTISSGVASYEPAIGSDENPLRQPIPYVQKMKGAINNFFEIEQPLGESFFPGAGVGYSMITVRDLEGGLFTDAPATGKVVHEFYTAREFPVLVKATDLSRYAPRKESKWSLIKTQSIEELVLSQGYSIELNDMHGKPRSVKVVNQGGSEISSTEYFYHVEDPKAINLKLNNKVTTISRNGSVAQSVIGRDIDFFTDFREQETNNTGNAINIGLDVIPIIFGIPFPLPHWPVNGNNDYKLFRSVCAVKVIQTNGIVSGIRKTENGSSVLVENVAYDGISGEAVITKTQNEFKQDYYTVNLPAYWIYDKMGGAYRNIGMIFNNASLNDCYQVQAPYGALLQPGDELIDLNTGTRYWAHWSTVFNDGLSGGMSLIGSNGALVTSLPGNNVLKIVRSSYRNLFSATAGSIVSLNNPIVGNQLSVFNNGPENSFKVISAAASNFSDQWIDELDPVLADALPASYTIDASSTGTVTVNPYLHGMFGNWKPYQQYVYQQQRAYDQPFNAAKKGMNLKEAGILNGFNAYWQLSYGSWYAATGTNWIKANTVTLYDRYGQELENKDALGRFSAATFDFKGQLPAAVASNAQNREIYVASFEDKLRHLNADTRIKATEFKSAGSTPLNELITSDQSHSGKQSIALDEDGIVLKTQLSNKERKAASFIEATTSALVLKNSAGLYPNGFEPVPGKTYIISLWVKDTEHMNRDQNFTVELKGTSTPVAVPMNCRAIVERWKLFEGEFKADVALISYSMEIAIKNNGSPAVYVDDIRIHPKDAQLKSYAYDALNFKLMAELDENAFATFYEYDDEGALVRVKKETERGIATLKENRSSYRRNSP